MSDKFTPPSGEYEVTTRPATPKDGRLVANDDDKVLMYQRHAVHIVTETEWNALQAELKDLRERVAKLED